MTEPSLQLQDASQTKECPPSIPEHLRYKNRLQEYTQRSSILLPVYHTFNEGGPQRFRSRVLVDGKEYVSPTTFSNRKAAEQDVARIALESIFQTIKDDIYPFIHEDTIFCKSILHEHAAKMFLEKPTYNTEQANPYFVSEVTFNGVKFKGERGRSKKEAEQMAARAAILSVLDSGSRTTISEIIKSKSRLYSAFSRASNTSSIASDSMLIAADSSGDLNLPSNKRKEFENTREIGTVTKLPINGASEAQASAAHVPRLPFHEFKKPKVQSSSEVVAPPIIFVPPALGEPLACSTSINNINGKNQKEDKAAEQGVQGNAQLAVARMPMSQVPPHPVAQ